MKDYIPGLLSCVFILCVSQYHKYKTDKYIKRTQIDKRKIEEIMRKNRIY